MNEKRAWLLTVGEYDDYAVLGVVLSTEEDARTKAAALTAEREKAGEPSDLVYVDFETTEVL